MSCPNLSIASVKEEFDELKSVLNEPLAYLAWDRNNGYHLDKASNGEESELFNSLLSLTSRSQAIEIKTRLLSDKFKNWFGNSTMVDNNGEPIIQFVKDGKFVEQSKTAKPVISKSNKYSAANVLSIFNSDNNRPEQSLVEDKNVITSQNRNQLKVNESMANEIISDFNTYFPDYTYLNDEQRRVIADMVERGEIQITCNL
jgi:hypothetical protein